MCGILFCDISDHLPNFVSISHGHLNTSRENRTLTRIFTERNCANFIRKIETDNWELCITTINKIGMAVL